jgi:hypothetical protein
MVEYEKPRLTMTSRDYETIGFAKLLDRLQQALDERYGPRPWGVVRNANGTRRNVYGPDGSPSDKASQPGEH